MPSDMSHLTHRFVLSTNRMEQFYDYMKKDIPEIGTFEEFVIQMGARKVDEFRGNIRIPKEAEEIQEKLLREFDDLLTEHIARHENCQPTKEYPTIFGFLQQIREGTL